MSIGENIKRLRIIHGLSQKELAQIAGVSDKAVSTWENGTKEPRMGAVQKIADHFGLKKSNLIEDNGLEINITPVKSPAPFAAQVQNSPPPSAQTCTPEEADLIQKYKQLDEAERELVDTMIDKLHEQRSGKFDASSHETTAS